MRRVWEKPPNGESPSSARFYLCGDRDEDKDGFGGRDGDDEAIPGPAPPRFHP